MDTLTKHKHADLILEQARQRAAGETIAGWWKWEFYSADKIGEWVNTTEPSFSFYIQYQFTMTDKHPNFVKIPTKTKLKLVNMIGLPNGSAVCVENHPTYGIVIANTGGNALCILVNDTQQLINQWMTYKLRIIEQKDFTYWGGGVCPVPAGVVVEVVMRNKRVEEYQAIGCRWSHDVYEKDIIAYRLVGLAEGWTDDPELADGLTDNLTK